MHPTTDADALQAAVLTLSEDAPDVAATTFLAPHGRWNGLISAVGSYVSGAEWREPERQDCSASSRERTRRFLPAPTREDRTRLYQRHCVRGRKKIVFGVG
jgi:hypothetical protein